MATLLAASWGQTVYDNGQRDSKAACQLLSFDSDPNRMSIYWAKLERELDAYRRKREERSQIDPERQAPNEERQPTQQPDTFGDCIRRWGMRHNGRTMERGDDAFNPAVGDCAAKLEILATIRTDSQPVRDLAWELDSSTLCYKRETAVYCPSVIRERVARVGVPVVGESEGWRMPELEPAAPYLTTTRIFADGDSASRITFGRERLTVELTIPKRAIVNPSTAGLEVLEALAESCRAMAEYERLRVLANCGS